MDEEELERLAAEELLREAKQGAARAVIHGALGWKKDSAPRTNKRFLTTTLANTMQYNYRRSRSRSRSSSPRHKYRRRSKEGSPSHEPSHRDKRHHSSKEQSHRKEREQKRETTHDSTVFIIVLIIKT